MDLLKKKKYQDVIVLDRGDNTLLCVNLNGAVITSWRHNNREQLFLSRCCIFDEKVAKTGGISLSFPVIGEWKFGPTDGFAKLMRWTVEEGPFMLKESKDIRIILSLEDDAYSRSFWNYQFKILYVITLLEKEVHLEVKLENVSPFKTVRCNVEIPIFFKVPNLKTAPIEGLAGYSYRNLTQKGIYQVDEEEGFIIDKWTNREYKGAPDKVAIDNLVDGNKMKIHKISLDDLTIWNPWEEHAKDIPNFFPEEYLNIIQVSPGNKFTVIKLLPKMAFECEVKLEIFKESLFEILPW